MDAALNQHSATRLCEFILQGPMEIRVSLVEPEVATGKR